jgi:hypothetical protein
VEKVALVIQVVEEVVEVKGEKLYKVLMEGQEVGVEILGDSIQEMVILEEVEEPDLLEMLLHLHNRPELPGSWEIPEVQIQECQENQEKKEIPEVQIQECQENQEKKEIQEVQIQECQENQEKKEIQEIQIQECLGVQEVREMKGKLGYQPLFLD